MRMIARTLSTALAACALATGAGSCGFGSGITQAGSESDSETSATQGCVPTESVCGPSTGVVKFAVDGDTIELESGERIRYLNVNTPESGFDGECFGDEAKDFNKEFVEGETVCLHYDEAECTDAYDRLLAYVETDAGEINTTLVEEGYGCAVVVPPSGVERADEFENLESKAMAAGKGLWGQCSADVCAF